MLPCTRTQLCVRTVVRLRLSFFCNDPATTEIYTLSLHDALPICTRAYGINRRARGAKMASKQRPVKSTSTVLLPIQSFRSEEHTSELQSHSDLVCRLLLEKKKNNKNNIILIK